MSKRKKWATSWSGQPDAKTSHDSERAVYDWLAEQSARLDQLRTPIVSIWRDERLGRGWELYERVDLREHAALLQISRTGPIGSLTTRDPSVLTTEQEKP